MASSSAALTTDDIAWVKAYASEVVQIFGREFSADADRFKEGQVLLDRSTRQ